MTSIVWANGMLRDPDEPILTAADHGLTVGDGVFETLTIRDGGPFALTRHLARLGYSAGRIGLAQPDLKRIRAAVGEVMEAGGGDITRLRITVTSGAGPMSSARGNGPHTVIVTGGQAARPRQCHAVRSPWKRNERSPLTGVKSTSYGDNAVAMAYARERDADEALMSNTYGNLCEGTATNVFVERDGEIVTPPLASGCLPGITRGLALEWAATAGLPIRVAAPGELPMSVLDDVADGSAHLAVTSSTRGVQHVSTLDGVSLTAGQQLRRLAALFELNAERNPDPPLPRQR